MIDRDMINSEEHSRRPTPDPGDTIAIVSLTHNRLHLLRQCVENVLHQTSEATTEVIVWDNASSDGTAEYLDSLTDSRIKVIHHTKNIGQNAYAPAVALTRANYLIELDDDITDAPYAWDRKLLDAFNKLPDIGYLQARLADDGYSPGARYFYHEKAHVYQLAVINGVRVWLGGPVGGGCTITSRTLYDEVGGFRQSRETFWAEDKAYIQDIKRLGYRAAILDEIEVFHAGGPHYSDRAPAKDAYYRRRKRSQARKAAIKRILLVIPLVARLNDRLQWFRPPQ